ncbi:CD99 isoform X2 [Xenopus laevis]|uniref:CD99 isoform X2 n=1 Tax=Xenopus laevis TaxID=8355 RepID=A0A8J0UIK3_XENLA|nr:CD99 isoform X2 [Xenopus laevis]
MFLSLGLLLCLLSLAPHITGQDDFDLGQAFGEDVDVTTKTPAAPNKPVDDKGPETPKPQPGGGGGGGGAGGGQDDFDLGQAFGEDVDVTTKTPAAPNKPVDGGHISDGDLFNGQPLPDDPKDREYQPSTDTEEHQEGEQKTNMIAGIVGAVGAAAVGAVSSFIAYQKKKLCFKESSGDPENVNMESYKGDQAEPQVQTSLLAK